MILTLLFLGIFSLLKPTTVQGFTHQFVLEDNVINLDFIKVKPTADNPEITPSSLDSTLFFTYQIEAKSGLPPDIPLFIATYDKEVIFFADASLADGISHDVEIDLKNFGLGDHSQMPIFYQNNFLEEYHLSLFNLNFINQTTVKSSAKIEDLSAIREKDNSLTIVFGLREDIKNTHVYQLFCLDKEHKIMSSTKLTQEDSFLWSRFSFSSFYTNQKNELIFHLKEFDCEGEIYILGDGLFKSNQTAIIGVENL